MSFIEQVDQLYRDIADMKKAGESLDYIASEYAAKMTRIVYGSFGTSYHSNLFYDSFIEKHKPTN